MDFAMRYDRWYRPLAAVIGLGPKRTTIRVADGALSITHGWAFRIDIPLDDIESARRAAIRLWSWGVHPMGDAWLVNGSRHDIVELRFARPVTSKTVKFVAGSWAEIRCLYLSPAEPDRFIAALSAEG